jgi:hypothetical protein
VPLWKIGIEGLALLLQQAIVSKASLGIRKGCVIRDAARRIVY